MYNLQGNQHSVLRKTNIKHHGKFEDFNLYTNSYLPIYKHIHKPSYTIGMVSMTSYNLKETSVGMSKEYQVSYDTRYQSARGPFVILISSGWIVLVPYIAYFWESILSIWYA